jgi:hypothetical protein
MIENATLWLEVKRTARWQRLVTALVLTNMSCK